MALKEIYESQDEIPEQFRELYTENEGKFSFTGVEGIAGSSQVKRLRDEAASHRIKAKEFQSKFEKIKSFGIEDPSEIGSKLERLEELELMQGKETDALVKLKEAHEGRVSKVKSEYETKLQENKALVSHYESMITDSYIKEAVAKAFQEWKKGKILPEAMEDAQMYAQRHLGAEIERDDNGVIRIKGLRTKENVGVTPDVEIGAWLSEMADRKPHWFGQSAGGGAAGSSKVGAGGDNPFSKAGWNKTQMALKVREDASRADQLAKVAGWASAIEAISASAPKG